MNQVQAATSPGGGVRRALTVDDYVNGVLGKDRSILGRAITLVESRNPDHHALAEEMVLRLLPYSGKAHRIGITGVPGVGKSTFIEGLGTMLCRSGHHVAVLAVDPSSSRSGGSILGDKTRMNDLSVQPNAFIRPSPSSGTLGGVASKTRETMVVCEAAGFDVVLVETVGVGQSETVVADMVDLFLVLMLPGAGDELQGIKKGVLEIADMIAVNKADGDNAIRAGLAAREYRSALRIMKAASPNWKPPVLTCAGLSGMGLDALWEKVLEHRTIMTETGELQARRVEQQIHWMWSMLDERLMLALRQHPVVKEMLPLTEKEIIDGQLTPTVAVERILEAFGVV
ncbi:MAG: methylmalonyl Co-A mutase-associated GTPase MeaB [Alphaproteobacteria bacterium]|nr:methylmalonyl Co-A mutase-associated GTPase MeaB [Alphaproteobacteria bacterium]MBF0128897.1 methylmalonyl Co-A mutase-associated GTPase MeaB [Alphaproteobacteria bacterium]